VVVVVVAGWTIGGPSASADDGDLRRS
jgi:hypothetical protein